jgi:hypothetical protein
MSSPFLPPSLAVVYEKLTSPSTWLVWSRMANSHAGGLGLADSAGSILQYAVGSPRFLLACHL